MSDASPAISGRWMDAAAKAKRLASLAAHSRAAQENGRIVAACQQDLILRLQSEMDIRTQQEAKIAAYFTRKRKVWMAAALVMLCASVASAQTTPAPVVNPTSVEFVCSPDHAVVDATNQPIVTGYVLELWTPGTDTALGIPANSTPEIPKAAFTVINGNTCKIAFTSIPGWGSTFVIPKGPTYLLAVLTKGAGGSARSPSSNPFTFPLPVPAPRPALGVIVK